VTLHVELVVPDRELWSGSARMVIAKTPDGNLGVLTSHPPVLGILTEGSIVRILDPEGDAGGSELVAAISGGFLSVYEDRVSILARHAELAREIDVAAARAEIESASGGDETTEVKYARARLQAAGEQA
jgi:F-type H+-transporting ATPase subunit epsilon